MNGKKSDRELIEEIYSVLFGNPAQQTGLIAKVNILEKAIKNNSKVSWGILITLIGCILTVIVKGIV